MMMDCPLMISDRQEQPGIIVLRYCGVAVNKSYPSFASVCGDILASQHRLEVLKLFKRSCREMICHEAVRAYLASGPEYKGFQ